MDNEIHPILNTLSLDDKARITAGRNLFSAEELPAVGLRAIRMVDGPIGVTSGRVDERDVSLLMPSGVALAATWDRDLVRQIGQLIGDEARQRNVNLMLGPNLNLPRSPLFGRAFETYSEDPWLTGTLGASWIDGVQSRGVGAMAKHVVGNDSETQRHAMNAVIDEQALREVYLLPFEMATKAGAWALMMAYNKVNGVPNVEQSDIIHILKNDWGWDGVVVSDWFATHDTVRSANAGLDLEMPGPARHFGLKLAEAVRADHVSETRLNDAVERVLRLASRARQLGEAQSLDTERITDPKTLLKQVAAAGFVLLKNDGNVLPGRFTAGQTIAVIGPNALVPCYQGATFAKISLGPDVETPLKAIRNRFSESCRVIYEPGVPLEYRLPPITAHHIRTPQVADTPGLTVEYFTGDATSAAPLASETRNASTLVWFGDMPGGGSTTRAGIVRASTIFTPETRGSYRFYFGGTGDVHIRVDGREVGVRPSPVKSGDVMGPLLRGDSDNVAHDVTAGVPIHLEYEMRFDAARAQGLWFGIKAPDQPGYMARAVQAAADANQVVLVVGETAESGVESRDRTTTKLPAEQIELIERVCAANTNTVVVVNAAHAVDMAWADKSRCVLQVWFPGQEFGAALAAVLVGELEPSGRLPITMAEKETDYPAFELTPDANLDVHYRESCAIGYRHFEARAIQPKFCFGHGLGYADFAYSDTRVNPTLDGQVAVETTVKNISARKGKEVVQVYVTGPEPTYPELKGFATLKLAPGASQTVTITLDERAFAHWSVKHHAWRVSPGTYTIAVGRSLHDVRGRGVIHMDTEP